MESNDKLVMISITYLKKNTNLINYNIKNNKNISNIITKVSIVSNEFTHIHEDNIDIYQILTDLKFSINCYVNQVLQFHFYSFKNIPDFKLVKLGIYKNLCVGKPLNNNIDKICNFTLTYDTLMNNYNIKAIGWAIPISNYSILKCKNHNEILAILQKTNLPTELCLIILDYLKKTINFNINCHYSNDFYSKNPHGFLCNPTLIIK